MPESPQVQALADFLDGRCRGATLLPVEVTAFSVLKTVDPAVAARAGMECVDVRRRGKFLAFGLAGPPVGEAALVVHLARAGWLAWRDDVPTTPARPGRGPLMLRLNWIDTDGAAVGRVDLTEAGTRKSSSAYIVRRITDVPGIAALGPDPLRGEVTPAGLGTILAGQGGAAIKGVLRQQSLLAGIGNAYSDEILHRARMSPYRRCSSFTESAVADLHAAMTAVLTEAYDSAAGRPPAELKDAKRVGMAVHGRAGQSCPVCGDTVAEVSFADSALQYCPTCQTGGKPLADRRLSRLLR